MDSVYVFLAVAAALGLIVMAARHERKRISLLGKESTLMENDGDESGSLLLTGILDGSSSHHGGAHGDGSHHGVSDNGSHSGGYDCGSRGGFDVSAHH